MFTKKTAQFILFFLVLLVIFQTGCKKNPMAPDMEDFTRPVIWINAFEMSFTASEASANSSSQILKVKNSGINTLTYSISDDADWLSVSPPNGSSTGQILEHLVSIDKSGLEAQDDSYTSVITITSSESYNSPQKVNVSLTISKSVLPQQDDPDDGDDPPPGDDPSALSASCSGSPVSGVVPLDVSFTASASGGIAPYSYSWNFGDGQSYSSQNPSHTYSSAGTYTAILTVTDSTNSKATDSTTITTSASQPPATGNKIEVKCNPSSASADTIVNVPISIKGNENEIKVFGLELTFDPNMFEFQSVEKGNLTGSWAAVAGNETTSGTLKIGGFLGAGTSIPTGSDGSIAIVKLKVTGSSYSSGQQCQVSINSYTDDIAGMSPEPANTTFTLQK